MGPRFRVSSERLEKPGIEPTTPGLEGEQLNHYATEASYRNTNNFFVKFSPQSNVDSIQAI